MPAPQLKLAPFKVTDRIEMFIARFEEAAEVMQFDEAMKRIQFMSLFEGQALEVIHRLDEDARDYECMKEALLSAYGKSVEDLKKQFFSATLGDDETAIQFAARLKGYFEQWRRKDGAEDTAEGIKDLILRAQYVKSCPEELVARLKMDKVKSLCEMKEMANSYFEACGRRKEPDTNARESPACDKAQRRHIACGITDNLSDDRLILGTGTVGDREVTVMRDNGATVCVLRHCLAREHEFTGAHRTVWLLNGEPIVAPEVEVWVDTPFYQGWITAVTLEKPLYDLVIGNVAGVSDESSSLPVVAPNREALPDVRESGEISSFPEVRREYAGAAMLSSDVSIRPDSVRQMAVQSPRDLAHSDKFRREVMSDSSPRSVRAKAMDGRAIQLNSCVSRFVQERGVLLRDVTWRSGEQRRQLGVPRKFRGAVIESAHHPSPGKSLGGRKTLARVQEKYYWPGMSRDVARHVKSCYSCHGSKLWGRRESASGAGERVLSHEKAEVLELVRARLAL